MKVGAQKRDLKVPSKGNYDAKKKKCRLGIKIGY